jgi:hypothetical protein
MNAMSKNTQPLCRTCRFNELRRYFINSQRAESRGCAKHIAGFPEMHDCRDYEREPGTDDE